MGRSLPEPPHPGPCPFPEPRWEWTRVGELSGMVDTWADLDVAEVERRERVLKAWQAARHLRSKWDARQSAKLRAAERKTLPHPNWRAREPYCAVNVVRVPSELYPPRDGYTGPPHRSRWERWTRECRARVVAWDVTDRRAVGGLYGACREHLARAMTDDPTREWWWGDARPVVFDDIEDELTMLAIEALGG